MKAKKLLALTLALILALSCMSITAFAEATEKAVTYTVVTDTVAPGTVGNTKIATVSDTIGFTNGTITVIPDVVKTESSTATAETAITATFGTGEDNDSLYVVSTASTESDRYFVRLHATKGEGASLEECYTFIPFVVGATLDLEGGDDYLDTKSGIEQTYTATVNTPKTDKTKVQVSWKLEDITVTVTNNKVWNTETLTWDEDTSKTNGAAASDPTAEFNFVNLSSKDVYAKLTFAKDANIAHEPTKAFTDNEETAGAGDGIIKLGNKATSAETDNTGKIKLALTVTDSDFDSITANGSGTYGTYTVTISGQPFKTLVTGITLLKTTYSITRSTSAALNELFVDRCVAPVNATEKTVTWTSSDSSIVSIEGNLFQSYMTKGTAVLRATANDGSGIYAECTVTVE